MHVGQAETDQNPDEGQREHEEPSADATISWEQNWSDQTECKGKPLASDFNRGAHQHHTECHYRGSECQTSGVQPPATEQQCAELHRLSHQARRLRLVVLCAQPPEINEDLNERDYSICRHAD